MPSTSGSSSTAWSTSTETLSVCQGTAYGVLAGTLLDLPEPIRARAGGNLLIGLAMEEYHVRYERGDFLIRNLVGPRFRRATPTLHQKQRSRDCSTRPERLSQPASRKRATQPEWRPPRPGITLSRRRSSCPAHPTGSDAARRPRCEPRRHGAWPSSGPAGPRSPRPPTPAPRPPR